MPEVTILRRERTVQVPAERQAVEVVEVTFVTDVHGIHSVIRPLGLYRASTTEELVANPRYRMVPVDQAAEAAERKAIQTYLEEYSRQTPARFEIP